VNVELPVDPRQVELDGTGAEKQRCADLAIRFSLRGVDRDLELLRCELLLIRRAAAANRLARGAKLGGRPRRPRHRGQRIENVIGRSQLLARLAPPPGPSEAFAEAQPRSGELERVVPEVVVRDRTGKRRVEVGLRKESPAAVDDGKLPGRWACDRLELAENRLGLVSAAGADERLDQVRRGRDEELAVAGRS
jgi:hypothetical protein